MRFVSRDARRQAPKYSFGSNRFRVLLGFFGIILLLLVGRLVQLQIILADDYSTQAANSRTVSVELSPRRGTIYDRNGKVLASDVQATTIYCNPKEITDVKSTAEKLAGVLGGDASIYEGALSTENTTFAYVKRKVDQDKGEEVQGLGLDGIYFLDDMKRVYPYGSTAGQILGLVDVDGNGQTGLELYYDSILKGEPGKLVLQQGAYGMPIPDGTEVDEPAKDGQDIILSIDIDMQQYVEERLTKGVSDIGGEDGSAVLYDADSGDIIAIASTPYLDPSDRSNIEEGATSVKAITTQFEPGSIFKTASFCAMLEAGGITAQTTVDCPVYLEADEYKIFQVIYNLVNNAINYTGDDKQIWVRQIVREDGYVRIEVTDSGEGITPEALPYVWDRYYKVDKTHKRAVMGTGLGLSIVKNILELHDARYGVESEVGKGSTFWFELKVYQIV